ncbi:MAG TPA: hypothetical protein VJ377_00195 [Dehalococcoidales bacterium]|nr:hypothetical protein [Dehalococcoidales bacterium]
MPEGDWFVLMGVGGVFIVLGIIGLLWGRHEEKRYYESLTTRTDVREFVSHWPERPQPGALKVGGWIALALGVLMLLAGIVSWLVALSRA